MFVLNRRFYDEYFFAIARECSKKYQINVIYDPIQSNWTNHIKHNSIVFTQDYFNDGLSYSRLSHDDLDRVQSVDSLYLVSSVYNCNLDIKLPNLQCLHAGGDILFQQNQYPKLLTAKNKNWQSSCHWICLGLIPRPHRLITACVLFGHNLNEKGIFVSAGIHTNTCFSDYWNRSIELNLNQINLIEHGWSSLQHHKSLSTNLRYPATANNNTMNFDLGLRQLYKQTTVEIVMETTFFSRGIFVTEKYLNSVYGYNFPIIISNAGTVNYLRSNGFDMFDDIIDHSYDQVENPLERILQAVEKNINLLEDKEFAAQAWQENKSRFDKNYYFAKDYMYNHFRDQFFSELNKLM